MAVTRRRYRLYMDFLPICGWMRRHYHGFPERGQWSFTYPFWVNNHTHPGFTHWMAHRIGLWEEGGELVGIAMYELDLGVAHFMARPEFSWLKGKQMIDYAEEELSAESGEGRILQIHCEKWEDGLREELARRGYEMVQSEPNNIYRYSQGFPEARLPEGFSVRSTSEGVDVEKLNRLLWTGFDHEGPVGYDRDNILIADSGPDRQNELDTIVVAPNGDYACYAGMWTDGVNPFAYLEPLCTAPEYRRMGLATLALGLSMRKTAERGAEFCTGGSREFYSAIGFREAGRHEVWERAWQPTA